MKFSKLFSLLRRVTRTSPARQSVRLSLEAFEDRCVPSTFNWFQNVDGDFNDASKWRDQNGNPGVPGPNDDASIGSSSITVTSSVNNTVRSLRSSARLTLTGGIFSVGDTINSSTLGELVINGGAMFQVTAGMTSLNGGTADLGNFNVASGATLNFTSGTHHLNGATTLGGQGHYVLNGGELTVDTTVAAPQNFQLAGGTLDGSGTFLVDNVMMTWTGGGMGGTGLTQITATATLSISGANEKELDARTLQTDGTVTYTGGGQFRTDDAAQINNNGTWTLDGNERFANGPNPTATFSNAGMFIQHTGLGTTQVNIRFDNLGGLEVGSGTLEMNGGGFSSGTFTVDPGTTLLFGGGTETLSSGVAFPGSGLTRVDGGTLLVNTPVSMVAFSLVSGTLGGTDTLTVSGTLTWTGGAMTGTGSTVIPGTASLGISGANEKELDARTLETDGTVTFTGGGQLRTDDSPQINNNGTWAINGNERFANGPNPTAIFSNAGAFLQNTGPGTTQINIRFDNLGGLEVGSGTLQMNGGGFSSGTFTVDAGTTLQFDGGTQTLSSGVTFVGNGVTRVDGGSLLVEAPVSAPNFSLGGGTLGGTDTLTVSGAFTWTGGTMADTGATVIANTGTLSISGANDKELDARTLETDGTTTLTGAGQFRTDDAPQINNNGTWTINGNERFVNGPNPTATFSNAGTLTQASGPGTTVINILVNNSGMLNLNSGTLQLARGGYSTGAFNALAGTTLQFTGGTQTLTTGASLPSAGLTQVTSGGGLIIDTMVSVQSFGLINGTVEITANGILNVGGNYDQTVNGTLVIDLGGTSPGAGYGQLNVAGTANLAGNLSVNLVNDYAPVVGDSFRVLTFGARNGDFGRKDLPSLGTGRRMDAAYDAGGLTLAVVSA
jgi:hypothetical protein